jgi:cell division protein ZapA
VNQANTVSVKILDREYQVACPEEQQGELVVSAKYLDKQMRSIRESGKVIGLERIAVMAALNISHELLQASESVSAPTASPRTPSAAQDGAVKQLNSKLDEALYQLRQMEIS